MAMLQLCPPTNTTSAGAYTGRATTWPATHVHPTAIVERREAPRGIVDPRPAPRFHPGPVAVAVRRPARGHGTGHPHHPVIRGFTPVAVVIQVLVADHAAGDVARRARVVPAAVASGAPVLPLVRADRVAHVVARRGAARYHGCLLRVHREGGGRGGDLGFAASHGDRRRVAAGIDVHAIHARAQQGYRAVWCIDLEALVLAQVAHAHVERPL